MVNKSSSSRKKYRKSQRGGTSQKKNTRQSRKEEEEQFEQISLRPLLAAPVLAASLPQFGGAGGGLAGDSSGSEPWGRGGFQLFGKWHYPDETSLAMRHTPPAYQPHIHPIVPGVNRSVAMGNASYDRHDFYPYPSQDPLKIFYDSTANEKYSNEKIFEPRMEKMAMVENVTSLFNETQNNINDMADTFTKMSKLFEKIEAEAGLEGVKTNKKPLKEYIYDDEDLDEDLDEMEDPFPPPTHSILPKRGAYSGPIFFDEYGRYINIFGDMAEQDLGRRTYSPPIFFDEYGRYINDVNITTGDGLTARRNEIQNLLDNFRESWHMQQLASREAFVDGVLGKNNQTYVAYATRLAKAEHVYTGKVKRLRQPIKESERVELSLPYLTQRFSDMMFKLGMKPLAESGFFEKDSWYDDKRLNSFKEFEEKIRPGDPDYDEILTIYRRFQELDAFVEYEQELVQSFVEVEIDVALRSRQAADVQARLIEKYLLFRTQQFQELAVEEVTFFWEQNFGTLWAKYGYSNLNAEMNTRPEAALTKEYDFLSSETVFMYNRLKNNVTQKRADARELREKLRKKIDEHYNREQRENWQDFQKEKIQETKDLFYMASGLMLGLAVLSFAISSGLFMWLIMLVFQTILVVWGATNKNFRKIVKETKKSFKNLKYATEQLLIPLLPLKRLKRLYEELQRRRANLVEYVLYTLSHCSSFFLALMPFAAARYGLQKKPLSEQLKPLKKINIKQHFHSIMDASSIDEMDVLPYGPWQAHMGKTSTRKTSTRKTSTRKRCPNGSRKTKQRDGTFACVDKKNKAK
ncbi:MAG: hypothetical protein CMB20_004680 [Methanobacteriota archaeon]|nr:MAG: hypothetical protein CMB20_004680 [Euryarchaeota archaeon]|tara:strand:- start:15542 stop:17953 length:2412 start_codon:yes stop_codon:yes gene_type:complete